MIDTQLPGPTMNELTITRLLQNPMGAPAPPATPGDIVAVSDGTSTVYLTPAEYDRATEAELRYQLAQVPLPTRPATPS